MLIVAALTVLFLFLAAWAHDAVLRRRIKQALPRQGQFIETPQAHLHVLSTPQNPASDTAFVLIHGSSSSSYDMHLAWADKLSAHCTVLSFDRPGIGLSRLKTSWRNGLRKASQAMSHPGAQADELHHGVRQMGFKKIIVMGHSWGGSVAMAYAQRHGKEIDGAVIVAAPLYPWEGRSSWYNYLVTAPFIGRLFAHVMLTKYALPQLQKNVQATGYPEKVPDNYVVDAAIALVLFPAAFITNAIYAIALKDHLADMQSAYDAFDTPLILIGGDRDQTVFTKRNSNRFQAAYPASEMIYLRQVGHMLHHTQADIIVEAARRLADGEGVRAGLHDTPAQQTS